MTDKKVTIDYIFWCIIGVALGGVVFLIMSIIKLYHSDLKLLILASVFIVIPLLMQIFGCIGLAVDWFTKHKMNTTVVIDILQWISGIVGSAAIFDSVMRLTRNVHLVNNPVWISIDAVLIVLFLLWMAVSYLLNQCEKTQGGCPFCSQHL